MQAKNDPDRLDASFSARLRDRDPAALADLHSRIRGEVQSVIRSRVRDPETAADLEQEVYLFVFRSLDRFDAERPLAPWVRTIAKLFMRYLFDIPWRFKSSRDRNLAMGNSLVGTASDSSL